MCEGEIRETSSKNARVAKTIRPYGTLGVMQARDLMPGRQRHVASREDDATNYLSLLFALPG